MVDAIGNLFVSLGLNSAEYETGLKQAKTSMDKFGASTAQTSLSMARASEAIAKGFTSMAGRVAVAAGTFLSVDAAITGAREALDYFGKISDQAAAAGVDSEFFQGIAYNAQLAGVEMDGLAGALATFAKNSGQLELGQGRLYSTLRQINPELVTQLQLATSQEERLRLVADAISQARDNAQAATIAAAAFGDQGTKLVAVFKDGAASIDAMIAKAREAGVVVSRDLIAKGDELGDKFDAVNMVIDTKLKVALYRLSPPLLAAKDKLADFLGLLAVALDQTNTVANREYINPLQNELAATYNDIATVKDRIAELQTQIAGGGPNGMILKLDLTDAEQKVADLTTHANELLDRIQHLQGYQDSSSSSGTATDTTTNPNLYGGSDIGLGMNPLNIDTAQFDNIVGGVAKVDEALKNSKSELTSWAEQLDQSVQDAADQVEETARRMQQAWSGTVGYTTDMLDALASAVGTSSKESFETTKKLNTASAIVSGIAATVEAYKKGFEIGGLPLALIWSGMAAVTTAARVAAIQSTSFNSTTAAGSSSGSGASSSTSSSSDSSGSTSQGISIVLQGNQDSKVSLSQVGDLINQINDYLGTQGKQLVVNYKGA